MSSIQPQLKFTDQGDERSYFRKYSSLPAKDKSTVRIIEHNNKDYFTVLNEDADLIADAVYKTSSVIKTSTQKYRFVTISPQVLANTVIRFLLVEKSFKIEFYSHKSFQLLNAATPANYENMVLEYGVNLDSMQPSFSSPIIASIKVDGKNKIGVCFIDLSLNKISLTEFVDNDLFSNLESLVIQIGIKEVIVQSTSENSESSEANKLYQVLEKNDVVISSIKPSLFNAKDIEQDLSKLITPSDGASSEKIELILGSKGINSIDFGLSFQCTAALINYLGLLSESEIKAFTIDKYDLNAYMKLDSSTVKALNIFPSASQNSPIAGNNSGSNITSIFELLNKCKTPAGSRLLSQWLKQPLTTLSSIEERQLLLQLLIDDTNLRIFISKDFLSQVPDIKRLLKKISGGIKRTSTNNENKKLEDIVRIYQLIIVLPDLINILKLTIEEQEQQKNAKVAKLIEEYWLTPISSYYDSLLKLQELVETTIDLSPLEYASSTSSALLTDFKIKPEFDEDLININEKLENALSTIKEHHQEVGDDLCIDIDKKLKLENHQQHGWCFRVTRTDSSILRQASENKYIELQTVKAGIFFTTKKLRGLSNSYQDLTQEYNSKQKEVVKQILSISLTYSIALNGLSMILAHLDVMNSFANVSIFATIPYVKPELIPMISSSDDIKIRKLHLENARHPILEVQDDINFIGNDVKLGQSGKPEDGCPFAIITGPNMGGKSTYIRQIGVISLMAQIGCFIPVEPDSKPIVPIFDAILSRIGAGDSQLKGLSTFMIEMLETSSILSTASHNSLIIIDELGRGTSTYDGFGLAWSISEHLIKEINCFTLFATHFHELTELSKKYQSKVENLHVVAHIEEKKNGEKNNDEDDITLMYKVEPGISDKSFGIHVAELVKFPTKIVNMAKRKVSELQGTTNEEDSVIQNKKSKCNSEEFNTGITNLKMILKAWKEQCVDATSGKFEMNSQEAVGVLKDLVGNKYSEMVKKDKFINEVLTML
ncbi:DNA mismatch repair protein Msh2p [[Candida] railenensis]|uniref:DNA mismatch repair protein Msh2p n=1 Tax=[Candida] railenensis TaxID=45579 RepID=A0A9P0QLR2_9ASCO|nr:DNA mismatch repair protein Msh2p [[Candida] railenensis]